MHCHNLTCPVLSGIGKNIPKCIIKTMPTESIFKSGFQMTYKMIKNDSWIVHPHEHSFSYTTDKIDFDFSFNQ